MRNFCPNCGARIIMKTRDSKQTETLINYSFVVGYGKCPNCNTSWKVSQIIELPRTKKQGCTHTKNIPQQA